MTTQVPANIYNAVNPIAQQYGVPTPIWEDVAFIESGFNPQAVGDTGTSFGIFQLHKGGQLPSTYYNNPQAVFDPTLNAQLAMPNIAKAWQNLSSTFNAGSLQWWEQFAAQSGHPGGSPTEAVTVNEATKLQQGFPLFSSSSGISFLSTPAYSSSSSSASTNDNTSTILNKLISKDFWIRVGIGIVALLIIIMGMREFMRPKTLVRLHPPKTPERSETV